MGYLPHVPSDFSPSPFYMYKIPYMASIHESTPNWTKLNVMPGQILDCLI